VAGLDAMAKSIFVSYSHMDSELVLPVVMMLRGSVDFVFHDALVIKAGKKWRSVVQDALSTCELFAVFWCEHSAKSSEVKFEYKSGISAGKAVMPILLDSTPLPVSLRQYQWVDFRPLLGNQHGKAKPQEFETASGPGAGACGVVTTQEYQDWRWAQNYAAMELWGNFLARGLLPEEMTRAFSEGNNV
jgi:hypothetical protein